jgi:alpha-glucuronidase
VGAQLENPARRIDDQRYSDVLAQLEYQRRTTEVWRDAVNDWFHRTSGIDDAKHRVGHHPGATEAEAMRLEGYTVSEIKPWETSLWRQGHHLSASEMHGGTTLRGRARMVRAARTVLRPQRCGLAFPLVGRDSTRGRMERIRPLAGAQASIPPPPRAASSPQSALRPGDEIRVEGFPEGREPAALDYLEIVPAGQFAGKTPIEQYSLSLDTVCDRCI